MSADATPFALSVVDLARRVVFMKGPQFGASERGKPGLEACLVVDAKLPSVDGFTFLAAAAGHPISSIMITGVGDVAMAVKATKAGATDFFEKPFGRRELISGVARPSTRPAMPANTLLRNRTPMTSSTTSRRASAK